MTIATTVNKVIGQGNGATTAFSFSFLIPAASNAVVSYTDQFGNLTVLSSSQYTLSGIGNPNGGTITYPLSGSPMSAGQSLTLQRVIPLQQLTSLVNQSGFYPAVIEAALDNLQMQIQQLSAAGGISLQFPPTDSVLLNAILPTAANRANKLLSFDASGNVVAIASSAQSAVQVYLDMASSTDATKGAALMSYSSSLTYAPGTVGAAFAKVYTDFANSGASLNGYLPPWTNAVGRTVSNRLQDQINAADFGVGAGNTGAQNVAGLQAAINYAASIGGATIHINHGTYSFNASVSLAGANNTRISGDGPDATILQITSATADFLICPGTALYQTIDNLSLTSTVTRTAGAMINFGAGGLWKRGLIHRVRIQNHFNGINMPGFEQCTLSEVFIVTPSGAGTSLICGTASATNTGANLLVVDCFFRGYNDLTQTQPATGLCGVQVYDVQALFFVNTDMGNFLNQVMVVSPQTVCANCYFVQTFFDGTNNGDNVLFNGSGMIQQFQFTGCWFNGAGNAGAGHADCFGVDAQSGPTYYDINFTGCRFVSTSGCGFYTASRYMDFTFSGCVFTNCGFGSGSYKYGIMFQPTGGASFKGPVITGCKFQGSGSKDIRVELNANGVVVTGCNLGSGVSLVATQYLGNAEGNYDPANAGVGTSIASASTMVIPPTNHYVLVLGTTNIARIEPTYPGHIVTLRFSAVLTVQHSANNLRMVGDFVTSSVSTLTMCCEANGEWREVGRAVCT